MSMILLKVIHLYRRLFIILFMIIISFTLRAEEIDVAYPYIISADGDIIYDHQEGVLTASGNTRFVIEDLEILADKLMIYYREELILAEGDELIFQAGGQTFRGKALEYNYREGTGVIRKPAGRFNELSIAGDEIRFLETDNYQLQKVELTPCILPQPHYSLKAREIIVYPEERIIARNLWFYFAGKKVFYLPTYTMKFDAEKEKYDSVFLISDLGYDSKTGFFVQATYPYEIGENFKGEIIGELNQEGGTYLRMDNVYSVSPVLDIRNQYLYEDRINPEGDYVENNSLGVGLLYNNRGLRLSTGVKKDYLMDEIILDLDGRYTRGKFHYRYFNEFKEEGLVKETYSIDYRGKYPLQLMYRTGYSVDYLPYLKIDGLNYQVAGVSINSGLGIGKVTNKENSSDRLRLDMNLGKTLVRNDSFNLRVNTALQGNYYRTEDKDTVIYNYLQVGLNSTYYEDISPKLRLRAELKYDYSVDEGEAYIAEDRIKTGEKIRPALGLTYLQPEKYSAWHLDLSGSYELRNKELEELELKITREHDCFDYFFILDFIDRGIGLGINF